MFVAGEILVTRLEERHLPEMVALEKRCFSLPWSLAMIRSELENPFACYFAAELQDKLVGYAGLNRVLDEGYITNIATDPDHRRQGIAQALLSKLISIAVTEKLAFLTLEVRRSNEAAQLLYQKNGFETVGMRRGYYEKPAEDALLMTRRFAEKHCPDC